MDIGMLKMKWRIAERKLQFTNKLRTKDDNNVAKKLSNPRSKGFKKRMQPNRKRSGDTGRILDLADQEINKTRLIYNDVKTISCYN